MRIGRLALAAMTMLFGAAPSPPAVAEPSAAAEVRAADDVQAAARAQSQARLDDLVQQTRARFPDVPRFTVPEYLAFADTADVVLVDVRREEERAVSHIAGSIPYWEFEKNAEAYRDRPVVCYCTIGWRSSAYARDLVREGWDARNLEGSLLAWAQHDRELVGPDGPTRRLHVYGKRWNVLPPGWEGVW